MIVAAIAALWVTSALALGWISHQAVNDNLDTLEKLREWRQAARGAELRIKALEAELELARGDLEALRGRQQ
jgi:uncharacterized protein (DUF697 family)